MVRILHSGCFGRTLAPQLVPLVTALALVGPSLAACDCFVAPASQARQCCCDALIATPSTTTALTPNTCAGPCRVAATRRPAAEVEVIAQGAASAVALPAAAIFTRDAAGHASVAVGVAGSPLPAFPSHTILRI